MRILAVSFCLSLLTVGAYGQAANGTITGTVTDPAGAIVAGAAVEVQNTETGQLVQTVSTNTGAYTVTPLPVGSYSVTVTVAGFKKYVRTGLSLAAAQTLGIDVTLEVGGTNESVTVSAEASLLKTESGDVAHNITLNQLDNLPILGVGNANAGSSGVRNPFNSTVLIPGVSYSANTNMIVNGAPNNTAAYRVEGLDNTNHTVAFALQENQPSPDAIQEVAVQTSNYAPEFGQAGGGLFNITMKSGTNAFHGSAYEYFVNEDLNAGSPYSDDGFGARVRPRNRRNDFGGTVGGPVWIPKVYNGHNKTFFFFSLEVFRESSGLPFGITVPTDAYRAGNFSSILGTNSIAKDALGRDIFANQLFDPASRSTTASGQGFSNPFPNNTIPLSRFDPLAIKTLTLIPTAVNSNLTGNYAGFNTSQRVSSIPSIKIDHTLTSKTKLSGYWSTTGTDSQYSTPNGNADGLPELITGARGTFIHSATARFNTDYTATPTLLLHLGLGYSRISFIDDSPLTRNGGNFDCTTIALNGCFVNFNFPTFTSTMIAGTPAAALGGLQQLGNAQAHTHTLTLRPSANFNATWIKGNHTVKGGAEVWFQGNITAPPSGVLLTFATSTNGGATAQPFAPAAGLSGQAMGFPFANFLLGDVTTASQSAPTDNRMGKQQWGLFLQDSWKVTRKLTVDYGVRWDLATANREQYGRSATLGGLVANSAVGGRLGSPIFEGSCNCTFVDNYPYAIGPRVGVAYQLDAKTVIRGGWGFAYAPPTDIAASSAAISNNSPTGTNNFANLQVAGVLPRPTWPNFDPAQSPLAGQTTGFTGFTYLDNHASRPPRQNQFSIGVQREISRDFVLEASYVGNRGVWWPGPGGLINQVSPATFAKYGLNPFTNPADNTLLSSPISSAAVVSRVGGVLLPYSGYATSNTLINALRPYPQFSTIQVTGSPTGKTWYDSLQVKGTKRMSHGLQVNGTFTWSKAMTLIRQDIYNPTEAKSIQSTDQPFLFTANILYQTQKYFSNNVLAMVTKDWQFGAFLQYGSGLPLTPPAATTANNILGQATTTQMFRTGQPLFLKDLNCGCFNPLYDQVLNPAAWVTPAAGTFGPGPTQGLGGQSGTLYYSDFRQARRPQENFNIGRNFRITERVMFSVRAEFSNILNRTEIGNPAITNPTAPLTKNPQTGQLSGGFGTYTLSTVPRGQTPSGTTNSLAVGQLYSLPRQGTIVARIQF
jgi:hypothetical protein